MMKIPIIVSAVSSAAVWTTKNDCVTYQQFKKCLQQPDLQHSCRGCILSVLVKHLQEKGTYNKQSCTVLSHTHISELGVHSLFPPKKKSWIRILTCLKNTSEISCRYRKKPCKPTNCRHKPTSTTLSYSSCSSKMAKPREDITSESGSKVIYMVIVFGEHPIWAVLKMLILP